MEIDGPKSLKRWSNDLISQEKQEMAGNLWEMSTLDVELGNG